MNARKFEEQLDELMPTDSPEIGSKRVHSD
jgi:hypothetical protein